MATTEDRTFLSIPIVIETITYRCRHNYRFSVAKMISAPPYVLTHIGEGGADMDERMFLETIRDLTKYGHSYQVKTTIEERAMLDVIGDWVGDAKFEDPHKFPDFDVTTW